MSYIPSLRRTIVALLAAGALLGALTVPAIPVSAAAGVALSRYTAAPGDRVTVTGSGFHAGEAASVIAYLSVRGHAQQVQAPTAVNSTGNLQTSFVLPSGTNIGNYAVIARDSSGTSAKQSLSVWPLAFVRVGHGPPTVTVIESRKFYVSGAGFGANETVHISVNYPLYNGDTQTVSVNKQTNAGGRFYEAILHVPFDASARTDTLTATGQTSKKSATANLRVTYRPSISTSPSFIMPGGTITVRGTGFVPNTGVNVSMFFARTSGSTLTLSRSPVADGSGNFTTTLTPPGNIAIGTHTINAVDVTGGFRAAARISVTRRPQPTATATPQPQPTATPTPLPKPPKKNGIGFRYISLWYHSVRVGTWDHLTVQATPAKQMGIWVTVIFPNGTHYYYYKNTDVRGYWHKQFSIPRDAISKHSHEADITIQLWSGKKTVRYFLNFTLV